MGWFDHVKKGLNVASVVTKILPVPSWVKKSTQVASGGIEAYEMDRRAPATAKNPMDLQPMTYDPPAEGVLIIQLPGETFSRKIKLGELTYWLIRAAQEQTK